MAKLKLITRTRGTYSFFCPACKRRHLVFTAQEGYEHVKWDWDGDLNKPTITPSILINPQGKKHVPYIPVCHLFITNGMIQYLDDCTHELAGQTVELPDID